MSDVCQRVSCLLEAVTCTGEQAIRSTVHSVVVWILVSPSPISPQPQYYTGLFPSCQIQDDLSLYSIVGRALIIAHRQSVKW